MGPYKNSFWQICIVFTRFPDSKCLLKVNDWNVRKRCQICSKLTKKDTTIIDVFLVSLLSILKNFTPCSSFSIVKIYWFAGFLWYFFYLSNNFAVKIPENFILINLLLRLPRRMVKHLKNSLASAEELFECV